MTKGKRYSAEFKAKVALEAIREELTTAEMSKTQGIHPTMISGWKRAAIAKMASAFEVGAASDGLTVSEKKVGRRHAKIGQLVVERDFLASASSPVPGSGGKTQ